MFVIRNILCPFHTVLLSPRNQTRLQVQRETFAAIEKVKLKNYPLLEQAKSLENRLFMFKITNPNACPKYQARVTTARKHALTRFFRRKAQTVFNWETKGTI